jgi:hypothetical protein
MRDDLIERINKLMASDEGQRGMMAYRAAYHLLNEARAAIIELDDKLDAIYLQHKEEMTYHETD